MVSAEWIQTHWHNNLYEMSPDNIQRLEFRVIERAERREPVGYLAHPGYLVMSGAYAFHFELQPGVSWLEVSPFAARYLWEVGQAYAKAENKPCEHFGFYLGGEHPAFVALGNVLGLPTTYNEVQRVYTYTVAFTEENGKALQYSKDLDFSFSKELGSIGGASIVGTLALNAWGGNP